MWRCVVALAAVLWSGEAWAAVTLEALEAHAEAHAPGMARARSARGERAALKAAASRRWVANPTAQVMAGPRLEPGGAGVDLQVSLWQPLPLWGVFDARGEAARAGLAALDAALEVDRAAVRGQVRAAWAEALWARRRVEVAEQAALAERVASAVARQEAAGESSALDARLARGDAAQAQAALAAARARWAQARLRLIEVTGWPLEEALELPAGLPELAPVPALETLRAHGREVAAARARIEALRAGRAAARREASGEWSVGAQLGREGEAEGAAWVVLGGVSYTPALWERGQAEQAQADAELGAASVALADAERAAAVALRQRHAQAEASYAAWEALRGALLPRFVEDLERVERAWAQGELRLIEALEARRRLLELELQAADAWGQHLVDRAALDALVGR